MTIRVFGSEGSGTAGSARARVLSTISIGFSIMAAGFSETDIRRLGFGGLATPCSLLTDSVMSASGPIGCTVGSGDLDGSGVGRDE